jgi:hypothetical protein
MSFSFLPEGVFESEGTIGKEETRVEGSLKEDALVGAHSLAAITRECLPLVLRFVVNFLRLNHQ